LGVRHAGDDSPFPGFLARQNGDIACATIEFLGFGCRADSIRLRGKPGLEAGLFD